jgi:hypothetical protein
MKKIGTLEYIGSDGTTLPFEAVHFAIDDAARKEQWWTIPKRYWKYFEQGYIKELLS